MNTNLHSLTIQQIKDKYTAVLPARGWKTLKKDELIRFIIEHLAKNKNEDDTNVDVGAAKARSISC